MNPLAEAERWVEEGTRCLHIIDLDSAEEMKICPGKYERKAEV